MNRELTDGVLRLTLDDGKANAINGDLLAQLTAAADEAEHAGAALLIEGRTGVFSGGLDLKRLPALEPEALREVLLQFGRVMTRLFTFPRPVVVASTGHAIAGGAILLFTGDVRIGARGPFKVGLNETAIGLRLPRFTVEMARAQLVPSAWFSAIVAAELYSPSDGEARGFYTELADPEALRTTAMARARALALLPPDAFRENKLHLRGPKSRAAMEVYPRELDEFMRSIGALKR
jgi:enoyl-CoA hydratase